MNAPVLSDHQAAIWATYQRLRIRLADQLNRELARETGLSEADFEILVALVDHADEPVRAIALRCGLEWEKSRLSHQLRRMEQRGLVTREPCDEDSRSSVIRISDAGRELACKARKIHEQAVQRHVFDLLTPTEADALGNIAGTLLLGLDTPKHH